MKTTFTLLFTCIIVLQAAAQSPYTLSASSQAYTSLSGATSANGSAVWHTQFFTMPLGFTAKIGNTTVTRIFTDGSVIYADTSGTAVDIFQLFFAHTIDRGAAGASSKSPLLYTTTGTAPNRIFKLECRGGGFFEENARFHTFADSFNFQFWLYEGSNAAEIRFGGAKISHDTDYFPDGKPAFTGYFNVNISAGSGNKGYFASGTATAPYIDSFTATHMPAALSAYPASGTVYRFTPKGALSAGAIQTALAAAIYPTECSGSLTVQYYEATPGAYEVMSITGAATGIHGALQTGGNTVNAAVLAPGVYLLRIVDNAGGRSGTFRFVRQ